MLKIQAEEIVCLNQELISFVTGGASIEIIDHRLERTMVSFDCPDLSCTGLNCGTFLGCPSFSNCQSFDCTTFNYLPSYD